MSNTSDRELEVHLLAVQYLAFGICLIPSEMLQYIMKTPEMMSNTSDRELGVHLLAHQ